MGHHACIVCGTDVFLQRPRKVVRAIHSANQVFIVCLACFAKCYVGQESENFPLIDLKLAGSTGDSSWTSASVSKLSPDDLISAISRDAITNPLIVACSDMGFSLPGIPPAAPVLIAQNFGHNIPCANELTSLINRIGLKHIIVYGHTRCHYRLWLKNGCLDDSETAAETAIRAQLDYLTQAVEDRKVVSSDELSCHAWLYDENADSIAVYDPTIDRFTTQCSSAK
jgi:hypothetical protein